MNGGIDFGCVSENLGFCGSEMRFWDERNMKDVRELVALVLNDNE